MKRLLVAAITLLAPVCGRVHAADAPAKPNILVIVADDLGYGDIGVHGGKDVPTPNIDALAASGVRCTNGYVSAPYCSPSRAGFLTGRYQTRFGHEFNPHVGDEARAGPAARPAHHRRPPPRGGLCHRLGRQVASGLRSRRIIRSRAGSTTTSAFSSAGTITSCTRTPSREFGSAYSHNMIYRNRELQKLDGYTTDLFTDEALAFMDRHADKPWFLYLAYNAVHTPLEVLEKYGKRVPTSITDPERRGYLSLLIGLDDAIGRVTAYLRKTGKDKDTLIFFFSDNGGSGPQAVPRLQHRRQHPAARRQRPDARRRHPRAVLRLVARQVARGQDLRPAGDRAGHPADGLRCGRREAVGRAATA